MTYVTALKVLLKSAKMAIYSSRAAQIAALKYDEALTKVQPKYIDYANIFSFDLAIELPENIDINKQAIKLKNSKKLLYKFTA